MGEEGSWKETIRLSGALIRQPDFNNQFRRTRGVAPAHRWDINCVTYRFEAKKLSVHTDAIFAKFGMETQY